MKKYKIVLSTEVELEVENELELPDALEYHLEYNESPARFLDAIKITNIETGKKYTRQEIAEIFEVKEELN